MKSGVICSTFASSNASKLLSGNQSVPPCPPLLSLLPSPVPALPALHRFKTSRRGGAPLDPGALPPLLAAARGALPSLGCQLHALMSKTSMDSQPIPATALLDFYSKSGLLLDAVQLFDGMPVRDAVTWNALISCFVRQGLPADAVLASKAMAKEGIGLTGFTLCSVLKACAALRALRLGRQIHARVIVAGDDCVVLHTSIVDFYSSCRMIRDAMHVFARLNGNKDAAVYNSLINACIQNGLLEEAFSMIRLVKPNEIILTSILSACSGSSSLLYGKQVHSAAIRHALDSDAILCNALLDMYGKCGKIASAQIVFDRICKKSIVSWTSIIDAYGKNGHGVKAWKLFKRMVEEECHKVSPNEATFLSVLSACGHSGLVDQGLECFFLMRDKHGLKPNPEHYACLIDLLGRAGRIHEAWDVYWTLSPSSNKLTSGIYIAILNACLVCKDMLRGQEVAKHLLEVDHGNPASYILISNFYADIGEWALAEDFRRMMKERVLTKIVGNSHIAVGGCN